MHVIHAASYSNAETQTLRRKTKCLSNTGDNININEKKKIVINHPSQHTFSLSPATNLHVS